MRNIICINVMVFLIAVIVSAEKEFKFSKWILDTVAEQINLQTLFIDQISTTTSCAGICDTTLGCTSFMIDKLERTCHGYSVFESNSVVIVTHTTKYYKRQFEFDYHNFTTCGHSGPYGPTLTSCQSSYGVVWAFDLNLFNVSEGVQIWRVPKNAHYAIEAHGASGGHGNNGNENYGGGYGAKIARTFYLAENTLLHIACGQKGSDGPNSTPGGGGGGSFVYTGAIGGSGLLIAAGGGGGAGEENTGGGFDGQVGQQALFALGPSGENITGYGGIGYGGVTGQKTIPGAGWIQVVLEPVTEQDQTGEEAEEGHTILELNKLTSAGLMLGMDML